MTEIRAGLRELLAYMDDTRARLLETVNGINPDFAAIRPQEGEWSAAETVAHLAKVEAGIARLVEKSVQWARTHGIPPRASDESVISSLDAFRIAEPLSTMVAPEIVRPEEGVPLEASLESLARSREQLRNSLISGDDLDMTVIKRPHQVLGELNLLQWALFVAQHEERHRRQIDRTMGDVTERAAECAPIV
jgi:hypothetical protein